MYHRHPKKRLGSTFFWLSFLAFVSSGLWLWNPFWRWDLNEAPDESSNEMIAFTIEPGTSGVELAQRLEEEGLIVNDKSFIQALKSYELDENLCTGIFQLSPSMSLEEVLEHVSGTCNSDLQITIPEGWTIKDIDTELSSMGLIEPGDFIECTKSCSFDQEFLNGASSLEGYLFPDTYHIDPSSYSSEELITRMLDQFEAQWTDEMLEALDDSGRSMNEVIIMASMIEKEVVVDQDIVSGILWKRLDEDWYLGVDAALIYVLDHSELSYEDLESDSPYNLRNHMGLPPTAICNPGLISIKAALNPVESSYWYYITKPGTNETIFAETDEEHLQNIEDYLNE